MQRPSKALPGAGQIFELTVDLVQTSCGMGCPSMNTTKTESSYHNWAAKKGVEGRRDYRDEKTQKSLDGKPTAIMDKNT